VNVIAWTIPNMLTIVLMAVVGYVIVAFLFQGAMYLSGYKVSGPGIQGSPVFNWMSNYWRATSGSGS